MVKGFAWKPSITKIGRRADERDKARSEKARLHRLVLTSFTSQRQPPTQRHAVPRAEHQHCLNLRTARVRPEESAPLLSRVTNPGGRIPAGWKQIAVNLKLLADQPACFKNRLRCS
jgi:hypothetical protein